MTVQTLLGAIRDILSRPATPSEEVDEPSPCSHCHGAGWRYRGTRLLPCGWCGVVREHRLARVPLKFRSATLSRTYPDNLMPVIEKLSGAEASFLLTGHVGAGKTYLATAFYNDWLDDVASCAWWATPDLLAHIKASYNPRSDYADSDVIEQVSTVEMLLLDDLGSEYIKRDGRGPSWVEETLYRIIGRRCDEQRLTILTSNEDRNSLEPRLGERIVSRIFGLCLPRVWHVPGGDLRKGGVPT